MISLYVIYDNNIMLYIYICICVDLHVIACRLQQRRHTSAGIRTLGSRPQIAFPTPSHC